MDEHPHYVDPQSNLTHTIHHMNLEFVISAIRQADDTFDKFSDDVDWTNDDEQNRRELKQSRKFLEKLSRTKD